VTYDAVVIGSGPNGLVAANHLVDRGWSVLVLEAQPELGGAVRSAEDVHPGFVHDTFSAFYPLAAASTSTGCGGATPPPCSDIRYAGRDGRCCTGTARSPPG
jgi:phytoene dehydrogenase-like protein